MSDEWTHPVHIECISPGSVVDDETLATLQQHGYALATVRRTRDPNPHDPPAGCAGLRYGMEEWIFWKGSL